MDQQKVPYLCGGILFGLILQARKNRQKARNKLSGGGDGLSETDVMSGLVEIVTGEKVTAAGNTFSKCTAEYKSCRITSNTYIPFGDMTTVTAFNESDEKVLRYRALNFSKEYLNPHKLEWLVKAIIETIEKDGSIAKDTRFAVGVDTYAAKIELANIQKVTFEPFFLSVLRYILNQHPDNTKGQPTFDAWYRRESAHSAWQFNSRIGTARSARLDVISFMLEMRETRDEMQDEDAVPPKDVFAEYIKKSCADLNEAKTLLYVEKPRPFYDFYVCNDLQLRVSDHRYSEPLLREVSIDTLKRTSKKMIITGTGGIGKTMMMRHLFLNTASRYEELGILPVLLPLKNYTDKSKNLITMLYECVSEYDESITRHDLIGMLAGGKCLVLLDGYDEVPSSVLKSFETHLHHFIRSYHTLQIVLTSRPVSSFVSLQGFTVYEIMPFTKEQALTLIDKLAFHDRQAKEKFRKDLDARLYDSHYQFASNPLLLTIMLMTYSTYGNVPAKQHVFYAKAYETMAREHDATKGAYERPMHTNLTPEEFAAYFAEFCARTYRAELLEFTETSFAEYMNKVIVHRKKPIEASIRDFLKDLTDNLCIMYKEGEKYYFIHRSFQEYFTAVFFSTQMDDTLGKTGEFFERQPNRLYGDRTFDMLYDMIPEKVDRHIFLPFLERLWKRCDESRGYWTFLVAMYFTLYVHKGDTDEYRETDPKSYLYNFIVNEQQLRRNGQLDDLDWPKEIDECRKTRYLYPVDKDDVRIEAKNNILQVNIRISDERNEAGYLWKIDLENILSYPEKYGELIAFIEADTFPLKQEYLDMRRYTDELRERFHAKPASDDFFDDY